MIDKLRSARESELYPYARIVAAVRHRRGVRLSAAEVFTLGQMDDAIQQVALNWCDEFGMDYDALFKRGEIRLGQEAKTDD